MANPTQAHFRATRHVLRYLKGCPSRGLFFSRDSPIQLLAFSDADWGVALTQENQSLGTAFSSGILSYHGR